MGNSNHKYFSERDAHDLLGEDIWRRLISQLDALGGVVDFGIFHRMIVQKFRNIPKFMCECLFRGFANDIHSVIEVNDFICALALTRSLNTTLLMSFTFRVYDTQGIGEVSKAQLHKLLRIAYGSNLSQYNVNFDVDKLFENTSADDLISAREFETYRGPSRVLTEWVIAVLSSFVEQPPARLEALEIKYSTTREADQMMMQYNIPKSLCNKLYRMFTSLCQSHGRPEMELKIWLQLATKYVHPALAFEIFRAKLHDVKVAWRFVDFFEFCYLFGLFLPNMSEAEAEVHSATTFSTLERQAAALCTIFQLAAERDADVTTDAHHSIEDSDQPFVKENDDASSNRKVRMVAGRKLMIYMRRLIYLLSISSPSQISNANDDTISKLVRRVSIDPAEKSSYAYAAATAAAPILTPQFDVFKLSPLDTMTSSEMNKLSNLSAADAVGGNQVIAPIVVKALLELEASCKTEPTLKEYVGLLCGFSNFLPGFQQLSMLACCTFGVKPLVPELEKLYIIDLTLNRQDKAPQTKEFPNGPIGTEWALLSSAWLNSWRFFVGHKRRSSVHISDSIIKDQLTKDNFGEIRSFSSNPNRRKSGGGQPVIRNVVNAMLPMSLLSSILKPFGDSEKMMGNEDMPNNSADSTGDLGEVSSIDNISIVRKKPALATVVIRNEKVVKDKLNESTSVLSTTTVPVLIPGLDISQQLELVPPDVYQTLFLWYGGGPHISRKVIMNDIGKAELELYPMLIRVCRCDINGNPSADEKEFMFSKMATIGELIKGLCTYHRCPEDNAKLWDYSSSDWKNQKLLSDTSKSLADFGMVDGQLLLLEVSLGNGTWPRSQRQAEMEADSASASNKGTLQASSSLTSLVSASKIATVGVSLSRSNLPGVFSAGNLQKVPLNKGRVGLDNLGNTCYMSSSLQVLLHTDQLVEYFLRKAYLKHVNIRSRHGYKGRLAHAFGKLVTNLWSTDKSSVSPRQFRAELSQIREEFAGNEQHDAQELMVFLLDGLSEDVNLVHEKPYIENPDSDERSDEELANIWWGNHKKRENSVIHALFTGQFKSVMKCANCKHTSARFEPFNSLALPLLEDHTKAIFVDVITLGCKFRIQKCIVIVKRTDNLVAVINKIIDESFGILGLASTSPHFLVAQISESRVQEFHPLNREVSNVSNNETISIYEVITPYTRMSQTNNDNVTSRNDQHKTELSTVISKEFSTAELAMEDGMDIIKDPPPEPEEKNEILNSLFKDKGDCIVGDANHGEVSRLVVVQRRAKYTVGGGISNFSMEPIGLPIIDVVNKHMIASDVYSMVSSRLKHCLKAPLDLLMHGANSSGMYRHGVKGGLGTSSEASFSATRSSRTSNNAAITPEDGLVADNSSINDLKLYYDVGSDCESGQGSNRNSFEIPTVPAIRPIEMEEAVAKDISPHGFVLRYVRPDGVSCCKCPWIHGCQGCLLPDSSNVIIDIDDGTVLAADWHYVVYHELIESAGVSRRDIIHPSMENNRIERNVPKIALSSCFDKFMEEEKLDGIVCPKCHNDSRLSKNFILWRLPPVLFVQLKRFQYDKYSRRKLNDLVEFPVENLDLSPYLAAGSPHLFQDDNKMTKNAEDLRNCCCSSGEDLKQGHMCSKYSLYAVVHHVGIMGGGHYVASVRDNSASMEALHINVAAAEALKQGQAADIEAGTSPLQLEPSFGAATPLSKQWWCYNDSTVTPIKEEDVISPSAYLLFYMRNDVARGAHKLEDIFKYAESVDEDILNGQGGSDEDVDIERNCCEEVGQQTSTAKYNISDDVSTHRNRNAANSPTFTRGSEEDPLSPGMVARRNAGGKSSVTAAKRGGYTEEEFEKIMQTNADSSTPQCHVS